jgi:hypothetical protein
MGRQMAYMMQEMEAEFGDDDDDTSEDDMPATRSQSLSADFNRLTIEEQVSSSSRSGFIHGSSSTTVRAERHNIIPGDLTVVDNNLYQSNFDSHKRNNNIVENSFRQGQQENARVWRMFGMFVFVVFLNIFLMKLLVIARRKARQAHNPGRR